MLWVKSLHLIFMVSWFAGLFYLPRLFVYHAMATDGVSHERFVIMERKLFFGIMTPAAVLTVFFGSWLWFGLGMTPAWLGAKLSLVTILLGYHIYCGKIWLDFKRGLNRRGHVYYRWFNEFPVLLLAGIVILVVVKPF